MDLEERYAYPRVTRPWIRTNFVTTLDGAAQAANGLSGPLGGPADTEVFALLRSLADMILVGAGTARAEAYEPVKPTEIDVDLRHRMGLSPVPPIAVVSLSLNIPVALIAPGQLVITTEDAPAGRVAALREHVEVIAAGRGSVAWPHVLDQLAARGLNRILCEGGPGLHGTLIEHDLVDEMCLSLAPVLVGGAALRAAHSAMAVDQAMRLDHAIPAGDLLLTRYVRDRRRGTA